MSIYETSITNPKKQLEFYKQLSEQLQQENKILKENAENNDKVVDKVNWENQLLKKENKQLEENYERIYNENCILREKHNINDISLLDENYKIKNNWKKLKDWLVQLQKFKGINQQGFSWGVAQEVLDKMEEIEKSLYNEKSN